MALKRVAIPSPNYSSRGAAKVRLVVLHSAEGAKTYQGLGAYFANPASQVSSHVGIDDTPGTVGEYVKRDGKAWTQANANPVSVAAELCAWASWSSDEWGRHPNMLANAAAWVAEEAAAFNIPIVGLTPDQAQGFGRGVCQHRDLGLWGGGHVDCGPNFPINHVLALARAQGSPPPPQPSPPPPIKEGLDMGTLAYSTGATKGIWLIRGSKRALVSGPQQTALLALKVPKYEISETDLHQFAEVSWSVI
jgi:hypothetical protein